MPLYNTSSPTPSGKNSINSITVAYGIRDTLLNLNLLPIFPYTTKMNQLPSPRVGEPYLDTMVGNGSVVAPFGLPLETEGIFRKEFLTMLNKYKNFDDTLVSIDYIISPTLNPQSIPYSNDEYNSLMNKTILNEYLKKATIKNLYLDVDKQVDAADWISLNVNSTSQQLSSYLDNYGNLNLGGNASVNAIDVVGSVLNGGLGIAKGGVIPNFDIRSTLAGRILGATGVINDTKLGMIGGQQLALALSNNAAFNIQQDLLGKLNAKDNILGLIKNGKTVGFRPNYTITTPSSNLGGALDYTAKILGFTLPKSLLSANGSIFQDENGNAENIDRANAMILNTGKGQVVALLSNIKANLTVNSINSTFRSGYAPAYQDDKGKEAISVSESKLYAYYNDEGHFVNLLSSTDGVMPDISINKIKKISDSGFKSPEETFTGPTGNPGYDNRKLSDTGFTWTSGNGDAVNNIGNFDEIIGDKKSILSKTQKLFNSVGMKTIVTNKGDMNKKSSQIETANGGGFSKGSAVLSALMYNEDGSYSGLKLDASSTYCRSWATNGRYDHVYNLIRHRGLDSIPSVARRHIEGSVLDQNGMPKIAPYKGQVEDPKKFMFSIENLAWFDSIQDLPQCEVGSGDLVSGKKGRIMWFPPYNIQFSENNAVNWDANNFIGRGESVYTYNNTERSGTLSFQIIVDHPTYVNSFRGSNGPSDNYVASFFAGCIDPTSKMAEKLTVSEISSLALASVIVPIIKNVEVNVDPISFNIYFPNDTYTKIVPNYENGLGDGSPINYFDNQSGLSFGIGAYRKEVTPGITEQWDDNTNYGLNGFGNPSNNGEKYINIDGTEYKGWLDAGLIPAIKAYLTKYGGTFSVKIKGYASPQGKEGSNVKLAIGRANTIKTILKAEFDTEFPKLIFEALESEPILSSGCIVGKGSAVSTKECKLDRRASIIISFNAESTDEAKSKNVIDNGNRTTISTKITSKFLDECNYFEQLKQNDPFIFDSFREKIKYFHPAFHSTTPEGLNSRLTFLLQCTRQGKTLEKQGANNLAFGRPPVCILRIGDFYNTKIIMDNVGIEYEPLVWDLNPEGIGVQPMIANVSISFKFIGGSTLLGPINKLQNALSFNYFANTQVYDPRADYISKSSAEEGSGYKIVNDDLNISGFDKLITTITDSNGKVISSSSINQEKTAEVVETKAANNNAIGVTPVFTGKTDMELIKIVNCTYSGEKSPIFNSINGEININVEVSGTLSSSYNVRVTLYDKDSKAFELGVSKISTTNILSFKANFDKFNPTTAIRPYKIKFDLIKIGDFLGEIKNSEVIF